MKTMFLSILALFIFISAAQSQTFQFYRTSPRIIYGDTSSTGIVVAKAYYRNTSSTVQNFKFERVLNSLPGTTWGSSMCAQYCYGEEVSLIPPAGNHLPIDPNTGDTMTVDIHGATPGMATIIIKTYLESNPSNFIVDTFRVQLGSVGIRQISSVVDGYKLGQNYPNPFNPSTRINFSIAKAERISLKVYDILGNEVANLIPDKISQPGSFAVEFNSNDYKMSSGVYYYTLRTGNFVSTKKMLLVK
jgi:hypothetical protein